MSGATYRIEVRHEPSSPDDKLPYIARASRIGGDVEFVAFGGTAGIACARVRVMIATPTDAPETFYADEYGNLIDPPVSHSVKA